MPRSNIFRGSGYQKQVLLGKRTVKQGECCAVWDDTGKQTLVVGPQRIWVWKSTVRFVDRHFADQQQYLVIKHKNGTREHVRGPVTMFEDPVLYDQIEVKQGVHVNNCEVIVVYREDVEDKVVRRVVSGPLLFIPNANEWIHEFCWHGTDPENKTKLKANASRFQKLQTIAQQIYYNVSDVRTGDDAQITVKLMVFYEIADIDKLLDSTNDPIADITNAICSDVIQKCAQMTYEQFIQSTADFNSLGTYQNLTKMAESIGFRIPNVVYRGYHASDKLQAMHDAAIQSRTRLHNEADVAAQVEELEDLKLSKLQQRSLQQMEMERAAKTHALQLGASDHAEMLRRKEAECAEELKHKKLLAALQDESLQKKNDEQLRFLQQLRALGVDLNTYLASQNRKVDKTIVIEAPAGAAGSSSSSPPPSSSTWTSPRGAPRHPFLLPSRAG